MSFPRHAKYKESGVEWLGDIPEHWHVRRLKHVCQATPSNVDKKSHEGETAIELCNYTDVYYNDTIVADMNFMPATASDDQIAKFTLRAGDTIITKDSESADDIAVAAYVPNDLPGVVCGYHLSIVRPLAGTHGAFVKRFFDSSYAKSCFAVRANGLTRVGLSQYQIDNVILPVPPSTEQALIATFLDCETAKIDALIAEQQRLIELLNEKRQAVISHAVTKGLNADMPMKPSGVQWLGDVPEGWSVTRLKHVVRRDGSGVQIGPFGAMLKDLSTEPTGFKLYGQQNVISGDFEVGSRWISEETFRSHSAYQVCPGDLLVTRKGSLGNCRLVPTGVEPGWFDSDTICARVEPSMIYGRYLQLLLHEAGYIAKQIDETRRGAILSGINTEVLNGLIIILPPLSHQNELLAALDQLAGKFSALLAASQRSIDLLQERRTALISAAVTGQINVRALAERAAA